MTELRIVSVPELKPVLDVLLALTWPIAIEDVPTIFEQLGWEQGKRWEGLSSLPLSFPAASVGMLDDEVASFSFRISDTLSEVGPTSAATVIEAFTRLADVVSDYMGFTPTGTSLFDPGAVWDLPDGCQVQVIMEKDTVELWHWSAALARIVRIEWLSEIESGNDLVDPGSADLYLAASQLAPSTDPGPSAHQPKIFADSYVSQQHRFSLGEELTSPKSYLSFPVSNGLVDYEEYYALTADEFERFMDDPAQALPLLEQCRQHHQDHRLIQQPGSNRGTPV